MPSAPPQGVGSSFEVVTLGPPRYYRPPPSMGDPWGREWVAGVLGRVGYAAGDVSQVLDDAMAVNGELRRFLPRRRANGEPGTLRELVVAFHALDAVRRIDGGEGPAVVAGRNLCESVRGVTRRGYAAALVLYGAMLSRAGRSAEAVAAFREAVAVVRPAAPEPVTSPPPESC